MYRLVSGRILASGVSAICLVLAACSPTDKPGAADAAAPALATTGEITAADLGARIRELADDKYEGRAPGTESGETSAQWIADEFKRLGLEPVNGSYFQTVEMVAQTVDNATSSFSVTANGQPVAFKLGPDAVMGTKRQDQPTVTVADSDMVFVGYGVVAPEVGWNDYAGLDVKGKTVVMFVNDPGFITNDDTLFNGRAMTYYGRWTYKFEEAGRQGATGAILIHETEPAAYGWNVVEGSWTGEQADLVRADNGASRAMFEGWITLGKATELFRAAGLDIDAQRAAANTRGFKPAAMSGLKASATLNQTIEKRQSRNVIATIPGAATPDEHVLMMAHWDHLGIDPNVPEGQDRIFNGAIDNATGTAAIIEAAEKIKSGAPPQRSVTFLAVTLEESGLLGSAYFGEHPLIPLNRIVGGVNLDAMIPQGPTKDLVVIGAGASELEPMLASALEQSGRIARPDPDPNAGYFYRSDHISLAKKGVPMLYVKSGVDLLAGGEEAGRANAAAYRADAYHTPADNFDPAWDLSGIEADVRIAYEVVNQLANSTVWPQWYEGNEFRAIREESLKGK
jgi:Zn-dependent M28 family amino/carboxypeptidase